jgi:NAD(P)H-hydrate epimerase
MEIFSVTQIQELDKQTIIQESILSVELMERASMKFVEVFTKEISPQQRVFIFAGPGNNGGDALAIARLLAAENYTVECFLLNTSDKLSADCELNKEKILSIPAILFHEIKDRFVAPEITPNDIIIDGLFGSGLNKPLMGGFASLAKYMNNTGAKIYSIDIPSGLFGENNLPNSQRMIVKAYKTFTFQFPKLAFLLPDSGIYAGEWEVLDIGLHPETIDRMKTPFLYAEKQEIASLLQKRNRFAYKNQFGHALIVVGSKGKMGAAVLCAKACLKAGAGLVTVHLPACGEIVMQTAFPEAMTLADKGDQLITEIQDLSPYSVIGVGTGIGTREATASALKLLLTQNKKPLVIDADALNILSQNREWMDWIPVGSVLTPHEGEFDRLAGKSESSFDRLQKARNMASKLKSVIVLKGAHTAVCAPDLDVYFNSTGNPGMATAGSGDVLTGIITGLLAQGYASLDAARIGVYLHGLAGDIALKNQSQESLIASNIIDNLGAGFTELNSEC